MRGRLHLVVAAWVAVLAASVGVTQVFIAESWLPPALVAVTAAFAAGWVSRRLEVPLVLAPAVSAVVLVALLGLLFFRDTTAFGVPTSATLKELGTTIGLAFDDVRNLAAPVPATRPLVVLTCSGLFIVAALVDLTTFALRRPAVAGLPLLALYLVPASVTPELSHVVAFALAAAGYIALLNAEARERARGWGRRLMGIGALDEMRDVSPVSRVGRRIGTAAVGLAIVVPAFVPSFGDGFVGGGGGLGDGTGGARVATVVNPIVKLQPQLRSKDTTVLFTVRTAQPEYLRITSLDRFNGSD